MAREVVSRWAKSTTMRGKRKKNGSSKRRRWKACRGVEPQKYGGWSVPPVPRPGAAGPSSTRCREGRFGRARPHRSGSRRCIGLDQFPPQVQVSRVRTRRSPSSESSGPAPARARQHLPAPASTKSTGLRFYRRCVEERPRESSANHEWLPALRKKLLQKPSALRPGLSSFWNQLFSQFGMRFPPAGRAGASFSCRVSSFVRMLLDDLRQMRSQKSTLDRPRRTRRPKPDSVNSDQSTKLRRQTPVPGLECQPTVAALASELMASAWPSRISQRATSTPRSEITYSRGFRRKVCR